MLTFYMSVIFSISNGFLFGHLNGLENVSGLGSDFFYDIMFSAFQM